ncbi:MAG: hypothetical protein ACI91F_002697, partial [Candidatus Binatia bacterium]
PAERRAGMGAFARRERPALMDDGFGSEESFDFDAAAGAEPEQNHTLGAGLGRGESQADFDFPPVADQEEEHAGSMPAYLRRWRQRTSRTR